MWLIDKGRGQAPRKSAASIKKGGRPRGWRAPTASQGTRFLGARHRRRGGAAEAATN
jgi:hypothetical protein